MTDRAQSDERRRRAYVCGAVIAVTSIFLIDLCAAVFGCGCRSLWNGASALCNVHAPAPPRCPWCAHPGWGGAVAFFAITGAQAAAVFLPSGLAMAPRVLVAVAAMPVVGGAVGWLQGWVFAYWG